MAIGVTAPYGLGIYKQIGKIIYHVASFMNISMCGHVGNYIK